MKNLNIIILSNLVRGIVAALKSASIRKKDLLCTITLLFPDLAQASGDVLTFHSDIFRTGWNQYETTLRPANVDKNSFGPLSPIQLDEQVDAQPLVVAEQSIEGLSDKRTAVYVATENNTIYAIDARTGKFLLSPRNLGDPVPVKARLDCNNNGPNVGINGTPAIDQQTNTLYIIAYKMLLGKPGYQLHALDLSTLKDKPGSPVTVAASNKVGDTVFTFNPAIERQRPALLLANGKVYAAFGSFCDLYASEARGWVLGWDAKNLRPLDTTELTNKRTDKETAFCTYKKNHPCFLSAIWMSGYGPAADPEGNVYFTTGNSAPGSYDQKYNTAESVVKLAANLDLIGSFAPSNTYDLDVQDRDLGSGGVLVVPDITGSMHVAVAAGKDGQMFIIDREALAKNANKEKSVQIDRCFCGPSFFVGDDNVGRIVSSGGSRLQTWILDTTNGFDLRPEATASIAPSDPSRGFFTTVSSNGTQKDTAIIWALGRPVEADNHLVLYAFSTKITNGKLTLLYSDKAGSWQNLSGVPNLVPTVSHGLVFVASHRQLQIFGPKPTQQKDTAIAQAKEALGVSDTDSIYWGTVKQIEDDRVVIELRSGQILQVDVEQAVKKQRASLSEVGDSVVLTGIKRANGTLEAKKLLRAPGRSQWGPDVEY